MSKKLLIVLSCGGILLASALCLIFYFAFKPKADDGVFVMQDLTVYQGQSCDIEYSLKGQGTPTFSVTDESIAVVVDNKVMGLRAGTTFLSGRVKVGGKTYTQIAQVKVLEKPEEEENPQPSQLYFSLADMTGCQFSQADNVLTVGRAASFSVRLFSDADMTQEVIFIYQNPHLTFSGGVDSFEKQLSLFVLTTSGDGQITITFDDLSFSITIDVRLAA